MAPSQRVNHLRVGTKAARVGSYAELDAPSLKSTSVGLSRSQSARRGQHAASNGQQQRFIAGAAAAAARCYDHVKRAVILERVVADTIGCYRLFIHSFIRLLFIQAFILL